MALSITVNGAGTFTASMEEGPVSFTASLAAVGPAGPAGATGPAGVVAATAPITYNAGTQTVGISATPTFTSVTATTGNLTTVNLTTATFADATSQTTAFVGEARKEYIIARNNTGSTMAKGKVVYLSGATGNKPTMALAQADAEATSARTIGILVEQTANNADGKVIISGAAENIDTSAFNDGDTLYLSATTPGGMTTTLPTQPLHGVVIGIVTRANPSVGSVEVSINNYQELEELSDVLISGEANNDLLAWDSTDSVWKNRTFSALGLLTSSTAASTYAPIASPTFTGTVTTGGNVTFNDSQAPSVYQFKWDATTGIAGVYAGATAIVTLDNASGVVLHAPGGSPSSIKFSDNTTQTTKGLIPANNLSDLVSASTARTNLGLGTMATQSASTYAPLASPTFTGTVTIPAGASISGFAPLASPALTGTPTAPTAAASTNTTQIATTAFVQQEVPAASTTAAGKVELATSAEGLTGASTSLAVTPAALAYSRANPNVVPLQSLTWNPLTSGAGAAATQTADRRTVTAPTTVTGHGWIYWANFYARGQSNTSTIDWSKRFTFSVRCFRLTSPTDSNTICRCLIGKTAAGPTVGDLPRRGVGFTFAGNGALVLQVHDGTTLTNVTSSFTPVTNESFDARIESDGTGNVTLFVNDSSVATTSAGPSTQSGLYTTVSLEAVNIATISTTGMSAAFIFPTFDLRAS